MLNVKPFRHAPSFPSEHIPAIYLPKTDASTFFKPFRDLIL